MKVIWIDWRDSPLCLRPEDFAQVFNYSGDEAGTEFNVRIEEMTQEDFEGLPEWS